MDLRPYNLSPADIEEAKRVLSYQPFVISDSVVTGVAYNWLHVENPEDPTLFGREVYDRQVVGDDVFKLAFDANLQLLRTYETFAGFICRLFPGSNYVDVSCNTGYFPVVASLNGMGECVGIDPDGNFTATFDFLNRVTGSRAVFMEGLYLPGHSEVAKVVDRTILPIDRQFDVVSSMAYLCHVADPLHMLFALTRLAKKAVFVWSGFIESDEYLIRFNEPPSMAPVGTDRKGLQDLFQHRYILGTSMSTRLLTTTMRMLGFTGMVSIGYPPNGLPPNWHEKRMRHYQPFRAFLFVREAYADEVGARLQAR